MYALISARIQCECTCMFVCTYTSTESGGAPSTPQQPFELTRAESSSKPLPGGIYAVRITEDGMDQEERGKEQDDFNVFIVQVEINGSSFYFPLVS